MKKRLLGVLLAILLIVSTFAMTGCDLGVLKGPQGEPGEDGEDGKSPVIGYNGNWWIDNVDTGISALGKDGETGEQGLVGPQGPQGEQGIQGEKGEAGVSIEKVDLDTDGNLIITLSNGTKQTVEMPKEQHVHAFSEWKPCGSLDSMLLSYRICSECRNIEWKERSTMTWEEYNLAILDANVSIEAYVQATQSWWNNSVIVYLQDFDGGYLAYNLECSKEDAEKLIPGTKIRIKGYKGEWAGEVEILDGTFEFIDDGTTYIAKPIDLTSLLESDKLIDYQNMLVFFNDMTVVSVEYKAGEPGNDIFVTLSKNGIEYNFFVERYLTGPDTDVYKAVCELKAGDVVDVEGFLYWYNGMNPHITKITQSNSSLIQ